MFRNASELMESSPQDCYRSHVISFKWEDFQPVLTERVISSGEVRRLSMDPLDIFVSEARRCVGGEEACDAVLEGRMSHCRVCDSFPVQECRFQPRCRGTMCDDTVCGDPHVVYLAVFAANLKVGMTRSSRLTERGMEQGADMIISVGEYGSRMEARSAEQSLSRSRGIPQTMSLASLVNCLGDDSLDQAKARWEEVASSFTPLTEIVLDGYPLKGLDGAPRIMPSAGKHRGEVLGAKGRLAVYRDELGMLKALDMKDLVSRFIGTAPSLCAQSTLF